MQQLYKIVYGVGKTVRIKLQKVLLNAKKLS